MLYLQNNWSLYYMELTHSHLLIYEAGYDTEGINGIPRVSPDYYDSTSTIKVLPSTYKPTISSYYV